jgi:hypothetical protein
MSTLF